MLLLVIISCLTACKSTSPIISSRKGESNDKLTRSEKRKTNRLADQLTYVAKENILHLLWEQDQFLEKYLKN